MQTEEMQTEEVVLPGAVVVAEGAHQLLFNCRVQLHAVGVAVARWTEIEMPPAAGTGHAHGTGTGGRLAVTSLEE
jgi:hypothetical protein